MPSVSLEVALCTSEDVTVTTAAGTRLTYVRTLTGCWQLSYVRQRGQACQEVQTARLVQEVKMAETDTDLCWRFIAATMRAVHPRR